MEILRSFLYTCRQSACLSNYLLVSGNLWQAGIQGSRQAGARKRGLNGGFTPVLSLLVLYKIFKRYKFIGGKMYSKFAGKWYLTVLIVLFISYIIYLTYALQPTLAITTVATSTASTG
ncbi:MAG TPA: hypothetical protein VNE86_02135 [Nitrososphaerales archaeon]|nr:hypothetical protein [Nitrososphaerales archaeon]